MYDMRDRCADTVRLTPVRSGSLPREHIRDVYTAKSWLQFDQAVERLGHPKDQAAAEGRPIGFYFLKPEIIPHNGYGIHRFAGDNSKVAEFEVSLRFDTTPVCHSLKSLQTEKTLIGSRVQCPGSIGITVSFIPDAGPANAVVVNQYRSARVSLALSNQLYLFLF